jgi:arylsulfatase A-like enzyme
LRKEGYQNNRNEIKNAPIGKPNILLITMDATRADHLSCYGYERLTAPNLDKLSREGVLYKNAYSTIPGTLPSHASIFTSMYPSKHGAHNDFNPFKLPEGNHTLAEILSERGYRTAGIIGGFFVSHSPALPRGLIIMTIRFLPMWIRISAFS